MAKETVEALVEGGKATAAPPLGPALGPLGLNIGQVIAEINKKTADFKGMQVPIKIIADKATKEFTITVGTPPVSALVKKEAGIEKGAGNPLIDKVADLRIEQIIKIAKMKEDALLGKTMKEKVKEVMGTCNSMGVMVEGQAAKDAIGQVNDGKFDEKIKSGKTELSAEELKAMDEERKRLAEMIKTRRDEFTAKAKAVIESLTGKTNSEIRKKLHEAQIPELIIDELAPAEKAAPAAGKAAAPAAAKGGKK